MTGFLQFLLGLVGIGIGWAAFGAPLLWLAIRSGRKAPERAKVRAVPWSIAIAGWTGIVLGLVGFISGAGIGDESAGEIAGMLFSIGCVAGTPIGGIAAWFFITRKVRQEPPSQVRGLLDAPAVVTEVAADAERSALRHRRVAVGLLAVGTTTSLTGMVFSLSMGMISLAFASLLVRPMGGLFAVLHGVAAVLALRAVSAGQSETASSRARSAVLINVSGLLIAALIAVAGPGFFDSLLKGAARGLAR